MYTHRFSPTPKPATVRIKNFLGIDHSTEVGEVSVRRSPDASNVIVSDFGALEKRLGTQFVSDYQFIGVDNIYTYLNISKTRRFFIVVSDSTYNFSWPGGLKVFVGSGDPSSDFTVDESAPLDNGVDPYIVNSGYQIVHFPQSNNANLEIFYHTSGYFILATYSAGWTFTMVTLASFITTYTTYSNTTTLSTGYIKIPTTNIGRTLTNKGNLYEEANILTPYRFSTFLGNGSNTKFILDDKGTTNSVIKVWVYNDTTKVWDAKTVTTHYTYSSTTHIVTFVTAPAAPENVGVDNVKILFSTNLKVNTSGMIGKIVEFFGLNGNKDTLFVAVDRKEYFGKFSEEIYFGENGYMDNASMVTGYSQFGNNLAIHLDKINNSSTINMRTAGLDSQGELTYTNTIGVSGVGVYAPKTFANLRDEALWLSESGVMALVSNDVTGFNSAQLRSYYVKDIASQPWDQYYAFVFDDKYFLSNGTDLYLTDANSKHSDSDAGMSQYEWFKWSGIGITRAIDVNGRLYFINKNGVLFKFKKSTDSYPYYDTNTYNGEIIYNNVPTTDNTATWAGLTVPVGTIIFYYTSPYLYNWYYVHTEFLFSGGAIDDPMFSGYITEITSTVDVVFTVGSVYKYSGLYYMALTETSYVSYSVAAYRAANSILAGTVVTVGSVAHIPFTCYWKTPVMDLDDITAYKTINNVWVRVGGYYPSIVKIYYSTKGLVKTYTKAAPVTQETIIPTNRSDRKFKSIQFTIESSDGNPFSLIEIVFNYFKNGQIRG